MVALYLTNLVSILVSVDSVFEETSSLTTTFISYCFNPSFCGFGI